MQHPSIKDIFTYIYRNNAWYGQDSVSGPGSDLFQTRILVATLPVLFRKYNIRSLLDIPCGDFNWMSAVDMQDIEYAGGDIVEEIITNNRKFETEHISFRMMDIIGRSLPGVDLLLCRDCLVHFSNQDIFEALHNICKSGSRYLLTTTFTGRITNPDIKTGGWRPINLEKGPFCFQSPLSIINECTEGRGTYTDKSMGMWAISDIKDFIA